MPTDPGWTTSPSVLRVQKVALAMTAGTSSAVEIAQSLGCSAHDISDAFAELIADGLAKPAPRRLAGEGVLTAYLTGAGRARVEEWKSARTPGAIKQACTAALLSWLDAHDGEEIADTDEFFLDVRAHYFGEPFSADVVVLAARQLRDAGLMKGQGTTKAVFLRPEITPLGQAVSRQFGGDLAAWHASTAAGGNTINISGSTGVTVANNSPGARQAVRVTTDSREQILNLASALEGMTPVLGLEPADVARAAGLVGQLRDAADHVGSDPGRVRALLDAVKGVAINGAGSASGTALVALVEAVAKNV